jgi:hypothetical protein
VTRCAAARRRTRNRSLADHYANAAGGTDARRSSSSSWSLRNGVTPPGICSWLTPRRVPVLARAANPQSDAALVGTFLERRQRQSSMTKTSGRS